MVRASWAITKDGQKDQLLPKITPVGKNQIKINARDVMQQQDPYNVDQGLVTRLRHSRMVSIKQNHKTMTLMTIEPRDPPDLRTKVT